MELKHKIEAVFCDTGWVLIVPSGIETSLWDLYLMSLDRINCTELKGDEGAEVKRNRTRVY